jgi:hypothetical protein
MASTSAAATPVADWRNMYEKSIEHPSNLAELRCLFPVRLEQQDTIPKKYTVNLKHIKADAGNVPWTGYYTVYKGVTIALSNAFGVWFEVERRNNEIVAIRVARNSLKLLHKPAEQIDMKELLRSGESIDPSAPPSRAPTPFETPYNPPNVPQEEPEEEPERDEDMYAHIGWSTDTAREPPRHPKRCPRATGDDPFGLDNLLNDPDEKNTIRLEGIPPEKFTGERGQTIPFLTKFK